MTAGTWRPAVPAHPTWGWRGHRGSAVPQGSGIEVDGTTWRLDGEPPPATPGNNRRTYAEANPPR